MSDNFSTLDWARVNLQRVPCVQAKVPGPKSAAIHARTTKRLKGVSQQPRLFPVAFDSGEGCVLTDVDGNRYLDFSSGIYVATLGHAHPKVVEAVAQQAARLMNVHDFATPVKAQLAEKLAEVLPGDLNAFQFFDSGATAVEAGVRVLRAATGKQEVISCFRDYHGKTYETASLGRFPSAAYGGVRAPGAHLVPRPDPYRPLWTNSQGEIDTDAYLAFYDQYLSGATAGNVAGFCIEPIQGWAGTIVPPDDFLPKLRAFCDERSLLLMLDEVLTGWGRCGQWLASQHWGVVPDVVALGKSLGNGYPVSAVAVRAGLSAALDAISAATSTGGNPVACAAALAVTELIEREDLLLRARQLGEIALQRLAKIRDEHAIVGDVRGLGGLLGIELVKDKQTAEPHPEAGRLVYQRAFAKGIAWIPAGPTLRLSPPIVMDQQALLHGLDLIDEAIGEVQREMS